MLPLAFDVLVDVLVLVDGLLVVVLELELLDAGLLDAGLLAVVVLLELLDDELLVELLFEALLLAAAAACCLAASSFAAFSAASFAALSAASLAAASADPLFSLRKFTGTVSSRLFSVSPASLFRSSRIFGSCASICMCSTTSCHGTLYPAP